MPATSSDVAERAISFGWDLGRPRAVLLASIDPPTDASTLQRALATIAAAARATLGRDAIVWTRSATIAALRRPETDEPAERRRIAEGLRHELDERLHVRHREHRRRTSRGRPGATCRAASSKRAAPSTSVGGRRVATSPRCSTSSASNDSSRRRRPTTSPSSSSTRSAPSSTTTAPTTPTSSRRSEVWLETRNMAEAARRTHVHYNTFKNRLERIETILGPVMTDAARSLECEVAIYVARHYDGPWSTESGST